MVGIRNSSASLAIAAASWAETPAWYAVRTLARLGSSPLGAAFCWDDPDAAIDLLVARRQRELTALQASARALVAEMNVARQPDELLEILVGQRAVGDRFTQLVRGCEYELLVIDRPPYAAKSSPSEEEVTTRLRADVQVRGLYAPESLEAPGALEAALGTPWDRDAIAAWGEDHGWAEVGRETERFMAERIAAFPAGR